MTRTPLITLLLLLALAGTALAQGGGFSLGLASFGVIVSSDDPVGDDQLYGAALVGTYAFNDRMAVRGVFYNTEHQDFSTVDNTGIDAHFLFGSHLVREGFRYYGLAGFFSETWEGPGGDLDFSGATLGFGIGYTWRKVALDWWGAWRSAGDYQDVVDQLGLNVDTTAASGALALSYRF